MLFGRRDPLYPFERAILEAVVAAAPSATAHVLQAQLAQIRHVQRSRASPEINFYARRRGGGWAETWLLPARGDIRLARVVVRIDGRAYKGAVHAVSGHLFSLVLRPDVPRSRHAVAADIEIHWEPPPLIEEGQRDAALELVPESFSQAVPAEGEKPVASWAILSPGDIYVVSLPDADWVVIGAGPPGLLLLGRRTNSGESFCVANIEDDTFRPLAATSLGSALGEVDTGAVWRQSS